MSGSNESTLDALVRTDFGKGAARRTRRDGRVPAVIYGHGMDPLHVSLPGHETMLALKHRNGVLNVVLDGATHTTLAKTVQRDPVRQIIEHVDLIVVSRDERVEADIQVVTHGSGTADAVVVIEHPTVTVSAPATDLPESIEIDVTGWGPGTELLAKDLPLPAGVRVVIDPETVVVHASAARGASSAEDETGDEA